MTCVVGLVQHGRVYMGADSAGVAGTSLSVRADQKVFRNGEFVMGFTSSFRMGQLLRYSLSAPALREGQDVMSYMVTDFIEAVRACLGRGGFKTTKDGADIGGCFLVGFRGRLFEIDSDFQVGENVAPYSAVGCGTDLALGSMFSTADDPDPHKRILNALEAAATFSAGVRPPFNFIYSQEVAA